MNRVTQNSELWAGLPGQSELLHPFVAAGFFDAAEPPPDGPARGPVSAYYQRQGATLTAEVRYHAHLAHAAQELKRLLVAAESMRRAFELGHLPATGPLQSPAGQRGAVLLALAGLLEFPADQNWIDGLWSMALSVLRLPELSRSVVRACITDEDHQRSNYYGSERGLRQLLAALAASDPVSLERLSSPDPEIGRAGPVG
jgi:hypothetical protein